MLGFKRNDGQTNKAANTSTQSPNMLLCRAVPLVQFRQDYGYSSTTNREVGRLVAGNRPPLVIAYLVWCENISAGVIVVLTCLDSHKNSEFSSALFSFGLHEIKYIFSCFLK